LGPMIATANFTNAWLYVIAPIVGALVAALIHKALKLLAEDGNESAPRATAPAEWPSGCEKKVWRHNDVARLEQLLLKARVAIA
jgi:hypothetical protein